ncbi:MAG: peptidylprolyl isomerase [Planctomycetota bacterium]|jgi:hypothetical protein
MKNKKHRQVFILLIFIPFLYQAHRTNCSEIKYQVPDPKKSSHLSVAQVGLNRVDFTKAYEIWGPVWREVIISCHNKKISDNEADTKLQKSWTEALETSIREEIFYQEAERNMEKQINEYAKKAFESKKGPSAYMLDSPAYKGIRTRIKTRYYDMVQQNLQATIERQVKKAGDREKLYKILARQGVGWEEWKSMIRRKILINFYLESSVPQNRISQSRPSEVREYYKNNIKDFKKPDITVFKHIFFSFKLSGGEDKTKEIASSVYSELQEKVISFDDAVKKYSQDKSSIPAGGLEPLPRQLQTADSFSAERSLWLKEVKQAAAKISKKGLGPLLISESGCHIINIIEKQSGDAVPFSRAQKEIANLIRNQKREALIQKLYVRLKNTVRVKILMPEYPPKFSWNSIKSDNPDNPLEVLSNRQQTDGPEMNP